MSKFIYVTALAGIAVATYLMLAKKKKDTKFYATEIHTEDCVKAIAEKFPNTNSKDWKRKSKKNDGDKVRREFVNKKTGEEATVISKDEAIIQIEGGSSPARKSYFVEEIMDIDGRKSILVLMDDDNPIEKTVLNSKIQSNGISEGMYIYDDLTSAENDSRVRNAVEENNRLRESLISQYTQIIIPIKSIKCEMGHDDAMFCVRLKGKKENGELIVNKDGIIDGIEVDNAYETITFWNKDASGNSDIRNVRRPTGAKYDGKAKIGDDIRKYLEDIVISGRQEKSYSIYGYCLHPSHKGEWMVDLDIEYEDGRSNRPIWAKEEDAFFRAFGHPTPPSVRPTPKTIGELIGQMMESIAEEDTGGYMHHSILSELSAWELFKNLPKVKDDEGHKEEIDFENGALLSVDAKDNSMVISAGGDWQEPLTFTATLMPDGKLKCSNVIDEFDDNGLSYEEMLVIAYGDRSKAPKKLQKAKFE